MYSKRIRIGPEGCVFLPFLQQTQLNLYFTMVVSYRICLACSDETNAVIVRQFIGGRESFLVFEYQISETEYLLAQDLQTETNLDASVMTSLTVEIQETGDWKLPDKEKKGVESPQFNKKILALSIRFTLFDLFTF